MKRRQLLVAGVVMVVAPLIASGQKIARIGLLRFGDRQGVEQWIAAFEQGMRALGYVEGKNLKTEERFGEGNAERLPAMAADLVRLKVDVIVATDTPATRAAQQATKDIPIVFTTLNDPVGSGIVASLARPGANATGLSLMSSDVGAKQVELLASLVPKLSRIAVLVNPSNASHPTVLKGVQAAGDKSGVGVLPKNVQTLEQLDVAFTEIVQSRTGGLLVLADAFFTSHRARLAELALKNRLPSACLLENQAEAGLLISYGPDSRAHFRAAVPRRPARPRALTRPRFARRSSASSSPGRRDDRLAPLTPNHFKRNDA